MQSILEAAGQQHEFVLVERPDDLPKQAERAVAAARDRNGAVVAAGGDGTINAVAHAALPFNLPFGLVPQGTFNYSGRAHSIPLDVEQATRGLLNTRLKPVQVGAVNDRIFLVNASLGLYPKSLEDREAAEAQYGRHRSVAIWAGLRSLMQEHRQLSLEIEFDNEREMIRTPTLFIGNNPLQLERVGLPEAEDVQNRQLAAVIVKARSPMSLLWLALRGAIGQLGDAKNVRNFSFRKMSVNPWLLSRDSHSKPTSSRWSRHGRRDIKIAIDGEILHMHPPLTFSVAPHPLWLMVPTDAE